MATKFFMSLNRKPQIGILGLWHLGCVYATALADLGYFVTGFDLDAKTIAELNKSHSPLSEPGLEELLKKHLNRRLVFSSSPQAAIKNKPYIFVCVDVPVDDQDRGDMRPVNDLFSLIRKHASPKSTVVISSQVPVGTCRKLQQRLIKNNINVIYFPENLRLGQAYETFLRPDRIILGVFQESTALKFLTDFPHFDCPVLTMSWESAEMVKHALNSYLATNISFISEMGDLCELVGANLNDVIKALKTDNRVSPNAPFNPGTGFAGGTLGRDIQVLRHLSRRSHHQILLLDSVYRVNQNRLSQLLKKIKSVYPNLHHKKIGLLGLTYKPGTNTLRRSKSLELANALYKLGATLKAFDPAISQSISTHPSIKISTTLDGFFFGLDMAIIMTPWPQFISLSPSALRPMRQKVIIDTVNILNADDFTTAGITYLGTGYV